MRYASRSVDPSTPLAPAEIANLIPGTKLHLSDPRRTPVEVIELEPETASFLVRVTDFEDEGAEWSFALWDVSKFLVPPSAHRMPEQQIKSLCKNIERLNRHIQIDADKTRFQDSTTQIRNIRHQAKAILGQRLTELPSDPEKLFNSDAASAEWASALARLLKHYGLSAIEQAFIASYSSNPHAGEMIKGHRIILAELGLCPYAGQPVRSPDVFGGTWSKKLRRAHILTRMAFCRLMMERLELAAAPLYRAVYSDNEITTPRNSGFVSTTFSETVAKDLFRCGLETKASAIYWQKVPAERIFATFIETPPLSARYQEAEAILIYDPQNNLF